MFLKIIDENFLELKGTRLQMKRAYPVLRNIKKNCFLSFTYIHTKISEQQGLRENPKDFQRLIIGNE